MYIMYIGGGFVKIINMLEVFIKRDEHVPQYSNRPNYQLYMRI